MASTVAPSVTWISATTHTAFALTSFSIFIASITQSVWPCATSSFTATSMRTTRPGMGDFTTLSLVPPPPFFAAAAARWRSLSTWMYERWPLATQPSSGG